MCVVSQGPNVLRGERLVVDLTTGVSRVDAGKHGPVRMLIQQGRRRTRRAAGAGSPQLPASQSLELSGHRRRAVESRPPSDYHGRRHGSSPGAGQPTCLTTCSRCFGAAALRRAGEDGGGGRQPMADQSGNDGRLIGLGRPIESRAPGRRCRAGAIRRPTTGSRRRPMRSIRRNTRSRSLTRPIGRPRSTRSTPSRARRSAHAGDGASRSAQQRDRAAGRAAELSRRACGGEKLRRPQGGEGREPLRAPRRGGRPARARTAPARPRSST